jgi:DNA polymerase-3 subunit gamma/tau
VSVVPGSPAAAAAGPDHADGSGDPSAGKPSVDPRWREQARQHIRPTRQGGGAQAGAAEDLRDEAASINDSDVEDMDESQTELLARQLGAEIIGEEKHGF